MAKATTKKPIVKPTAGKKSPPIKLNEKGLLKDVVKRNKKLEESLDY